MNPFVNGFCSELRKVGGVVDDIKGKVVGARDDVTYRTGNSAMASYARGAMRKAGLDPDNPKHRKMVGLTAAAAVAVPLVLPSGNMVTGGLNNSRIKRIERRLDGGERIKQLERELAATKPSKAKRAGNLLKALLRRGK